MSKIVDKGLVDLLEPKKRYICFPPQYRERALGELNQHISSICRDDVDLEVSTITHQGNELLAVKSLNPDFDVGMGENSLLWNLDEPIPNLIASIENPKSFMSRLFGRAIGGAASSASFMPSSIPKIFQLAEKPARVPFFESISIIEAPSSNAGDHPSQGDGPQ